MFVQRRDIVAQCIDLAGNADRRAAVEEEGFRVISRRDIRNILKTALQA